MATIEFAEPFRLGDDEIKSAVVLPLRFARFVEVSRSAAAAQSDSLRFEVAMQRERIKAQATLVTSADKKVKLTDVTVGLLPIPVARKIIAALPGGEGEPGEVLNDSPAKDGITQAVLYKLGTPIKLGDGKEIAELEFLATNFGQLETVMAGSVELFQALDLLETVAKPVDSSLHRLMGNMVQQITLSDGLMVAAKILPRFLEQPAE